MEEEGSKGSLELFLVFFFSLLILFLVPFTIYQLCFVEDKKESSVKPWEQVRYIIRFLYHKYGIYQSSFEVPN